MLKKVINKLKSELGIKQIHPSETQKVRHLVLPYCKGYGCDIGFGGDKIVKLNCDGIDYAKPYAFAGHDKVDIACDVINEKIPVADSTYDYVYTSHLIEDFVDTKRGIEEFIRILKNHGILILVFPDQSVFEKYCKEYGQPNNPHHVHSNMGLAFMKDVLNSIEYIGYNILFEQNCEIDYNVIMVLEIRKM